jgi:hypothetical protein
MGVSRVKGKSVNMHLLVRLTAAAIFTSLTALAEGTAILANFKPVDTVHGTDNIAALVACAHITAIFALDKAVVARQITFKFFAWSSSRCSGGGSRVACTHITAIFALDKAVVARQITFKFFAWSSSGCSGGGSRVACTHITAIFALDKAIGALQTTLDLLAFGVGVALADAAIISIHLHAVVASQTADQRLANNRLSGSGRSWQARARVTTVDVLDSAVRASHATQLGTLQALVGSARGPDAVDKGDSLAVFAVVAGFVQTRCLQVSA